MMCAASERSYEYIGKGSLCIRSVETDACFLFAKLFGPRIIVTLSQKEGIAAKEGNYSCMTYSLISSKLIIRVSYLPT
jgi:hypothetical protein